MKVLQTFFKQHKVIILFSLVYLSWSFIQLKIKLFLTPAYFDGTLQYNHDQLLQFQYFNNEQSRILQWFIPQLLIDIFRISIFESYVLQRLVFIFLAFISFHLYLRKWFSSLESFAGVAAFAAIMPFTFVNDLQESSPLLLLTFLLALWAIRSHKTFFLFLIIAIGVLNNETMIVLPFGYLLYNYHSIKIKEFATLLLRTSLLSFSILPLIVIRLITINSPHLGGPYYILPDNINHIIHDLLNATIFNLYDKSSLYIFLIYGFLWIIPFLSFVNKPVFIKRLSYLIPIFVVCNLLTGIVNEVRQMLPLVFIIIPAFFFYIKSLDLD